MQTQPDFDETIRNKIRRGNNSGYLAEEYEVTQEFPELHDYHFRIEDEDEIIELEKLQQYSQPFTMQNSFSNCSDDFRGRLDQLIGQLDNHKVAFPNSMVPQNHGYYQLADHYNDDLAIEAVLQKANIEQVRQGVEKISLGENKPHFIKREKKKGDGNEVKALSKKFNRMTFTDQDL